MQSTIKEWLADAIVIVACVGLNLYLFALAAIEWTVDLLKRKRHA